MTTIQNGMPIRRQSSNSVGALGGFFTFGGSSIYGISNNHVLANFNNCKVGDNICLGGSAQVIGSLQYWIKLNLISNYLDVALFKLAPGIKPQWKTKGDTSHPGVIRSGIQGEAVYMMKDSDSPRIGRISNLVVDQHVTFSLSGNDYPFLNLAEIDPQNGQPFAVKGDSGNLVFSENNDDVLGVLIGTISDGSKSYYVPFENNQVGISAKYDLQVWTP